MMPSLSPLQADGRSLPTHVGLKFDAQGLPRPFPGNTIVCHVPQAGPLFTRLVDMRERLRAMPHACKLTFLPSSSYHMTVFEGASDLHRRAGFWFDELPLNASMAQCHVHVMQRLKNFRLECELPLRMAIDMNTDQHADHLGSLQLVPADEEQAQALNSLRGRLAARLGFRQPMHDNYRFHITLAYVLSALTDDEMCQHNAVKSKLMRSLIAQIPVIELGRPEVCIFKDMHAFERQFYLGEC